MARQLARSADEPHFPKKQYQTINRDWIEMQLAHSAADERSIYPSTLTLLFEVRS